MFFIKKILIINVQAFRIHVTLEAISTAAPSWPITFFVKKQNTGSALSFSVPIQCEGYVNSSSLIRILDMIVVLINPWCMRRRVTVIVLSVCVCVSVSLSVTTKSATYLVFTSQTKFLS